MTEEVVENKIKCASADCETVIDTDADSYWVSPFGEQKTLFSTTSSVMFNG